MREIKILDCTLRDGGLGIEDANKTGIKMRAFNEKIIDRTISYFSNSNLDIIELGSIEITDSDVTRYCIYPSIEEISKNGKGKKMYQASKKMMEHYKMLEKKKICQDIELEER